MLTDENAGEFFRELIEHSVDPILVHAEMRPIYANQAFLRLVGLRGFDDLHACGVDGIVAAHDRERIRRTHALRRDGHDAPAVMDVDLLHRDGSIIPVESRVSLCRLQGQECVSLCLTDVSGRKRIERDYLEQRQRFLEAEVVAQAGFFRWVRQGDVMELSANACTLLDLEPETDACSPSGFVDRFDPDHQHELWQAFAAVTEDTGEWGLEAVPTRGRLRYLRIALRAVYRDDGTIDGLSGFLVDVTELQRQREAMALLAQATHGSRDTIKAAAQALAVGLGYCRTMICRWSPDAETAQTLSNWDGDHFGDEFTFAIGDSPCAAIRSSEDILWVPDGIGRRFPNAPTLQGWYAHAYIGAPIRDAGGRVVGHVAACHDRPDRSSGNRDLIRYVAEWVSLELARRDAEDAVLANERLLQAVVDAVPAIIQLKDREGRYTFVNSAFARDLQVRKEDAIGRTAREIFKLGLSPAPLADIDRTEALDALAWDSNAPLPFQRVDHQINSGKPLHWLLTKQPIDLGPSRQRELLTLALDIGEQVRVEMALRDREEQLQAILDNLPGAALRARVQRDGTREFLFVSDGVRTVLGCAPDDMKDSRSEVLREIMEPGEAEQMRSEAAAAYAAGRAYVTTFRIRHPNGEARWLLHRSHVVAEDGDAWIVDSVILDATDHMRAERALRDRETQLQALLDNLPGAAFRTRLRSDGKREVLFVSKGFKELYGWDREDYQDDAGKLTALVLGESERPRFRAALDVAFDAGVSYTGKHRILTKDGEEKWVLFRARRSQREGPSRVVDSIAIDITDQIKAERALQEREAQLTAMLANLPGIAVRMRVYHNGVRVPLFLSEATLQLTGWSADEILSWGEDYLTRLFDDEMINEVGRQQLAAYARGEQFTGYIRIKRKDGRRVWLLHRGHVVATEPDAWIVDSIVIDVTEQREAEQKLAQRDARLRDLQAELLQVSRVSAMGTLSSAIAHELSQPLAAIGNYLAAAEQVMRQSTIELPGKADSYLGKARQQAERAGAMIGSLRRFFERGELAEQPEELNSVIDEAATLALLDRDAESITARFEFEPNLPPVLIDRLQIQQVVVNLIRNAVQAMSDTEMPVLVVRTLRDGDGAMVEVADRGPGLPQEVADRIFDRFATSRPKGMGMGLAICRSVLDAHGSNLQFRVGNPNGTVFYFRLGFAPKQPGS